MVFIPCQSNACVDFEIDEDLMVEETQYLPIHLERPSNLDERILLGGAGMLTVYDNPNDGK